MYDYFGNDLVVYDEQMAQGGTSIKSPIGDLPYYDGQNFYNQIQGQEYLTTSCRVWEEGRLANIAIEKHRQLAEIDYRKKAADEEKRTYEDGRRAERRADIISEREMQKTIVKICKDGKIQVEKELFAENKREDISFRVVNSYMLGGRGKKPVLYVVFAFDDGHFEEVFMRRDETSEKAINKKLNGCGISFGYMREKESQVRRLLIAELIQHSRDVEVPLHHGWNYEDGKWIFAFPEILTWKEVEQNV